MPNTTLRTIVATCLAAVLLAWCPDPATAGWRADRAAAADLLTAGRFQDAYRRVVASVPGRHDAHEREFFAGVVALSILGRPDAAIAHLSASVPHIAAVPKARRARAAAAAGYWIGKAYDAKGDRARARTAYAAAAAHPETWYGQLASDRLGIPVDVRGASAGGTYPTVSLWTDPRAPADLVHAVIRTESGFRARAVSSAGAVGLMQVMDGTAATIGRSIGMRIDKARMRADPAYNVAVGSHYLAKMLARYRGDPMLAAAAYNAGPGAVDDWLVRAGDPRTSADRTVWVEMIPYRETRDYVKKVLAAARVYVTMGGTTL